MKGRQHRFLAGALAGAIPASLFAFGLWYVSVHEGYGPDYEPAGMPTIVGGAAMLGAVAGTLGSFFRRAKPGAVVGALAVSAGWIGLVHALKLDPMSTFQPYDWAGAVLSLFAGAGAGAAGSWVGGPRSKKGAKPKTA